MKTILCYGDSNTWGHNPITQARYPLEQRWVTLLARDLGSAYLVIPEGLNGRTTVWPDPVKGKYKSGKSTLIPILESHHPLDLVVLMLGTNDLKHRFGLSAWDIACSAQTLVEMIQSSTFGPDGRAPGCCWLRRRPPACRARAMKRRSPEAMRSRSVWPTISSRSRTNSAAASWTPSVHVVSSKVDGIHLDAGELPKLAAAVAASVRELLG